MSKATEIDLEKLRLSGLISATARETGKKMVVPGARLEDIVKTCEGVIRDMGGVPAFPAQASRNSIAAHYCPSPGDPTEVQPDDIIKLDMGTHVDGWVTDNAVTVDLRDGPDSLLVTASRMALENAIQAMGPGASITEIGRQVESTIQALGFNPVYNLTGHGVARHVIHCAPSIPNYPDPRAGRLKAGMTIACEPFACDGKGYINEQGKAEVFGLKRDPRPKDKLPEAVQNALDSIAGLPFARRTLMLHMAADAKAAEEALQLLAKRRLLVEYPPLVEKAGVRVAQTEHTIHIAEDGIEVLTREPAPGT